MKYFLLVTCLFLLLNCVFLAPQERICIHLYKNVKEEKISIEQSDGEDGLDEDVRSSGGSDGNSAAYGSHQPVVFKVTDADGVEVSYERCDPSNFCYALWQTYKIGNVTSAVMMGQGCWESSDKQQDCEREACISDKKPPKAMNNTKFCCCSGNRCNANFTDQYVPTPDDPDIYSALDLDQQQEDRPTRIILFVCLPVISICIILVVFLLRQIVWINQTDSPTGGKQHPDQLNLMDGPGYKSNVYNVDHLKLVAIVGQGRYGSVWKGTVNEQDVAVKIFPAHYRNYYYNERDIYCLPFMDNPALLVYYGCDERTTMEGHTEYLLVLSYAPNGCLQDYLRAHTLDWPTFCKMALSIAKGLAHLHTDITKGDKSKPCVSHRDLNSRNILVKTDSSCCLCDFGFAMKISGSKYFHMGEEQHAETKSINEVGTLRYMAPEVLEGAVNLRDCESSLKQIDVYALGLVLWELATRCVDLYQHVEMPAYRLPFETEVGIHPSFEQMQALVSRRKARPLWPDTFRQDWSAARVVRDTTEDCWDQDAEARLTALCVEERLHELSAARDNRNRATIYSTAISPTLNSTQNLNGSIINNNTINNPTGTTTTAPNILPVYNHRDHTLPEPNGRIFNIQESTGGNSVSQPSTVGKDSINELSERTVETHYTMTPSETPNGHVYKNSNETAPYALSGAQLSMIQSLQPYQGRNPCLERNLMVPGSSMDDLQATSALIDKSFKHTSHYRSNSNAVETQNLLGHDYLNQNSSNHHQQNGVGLSIMPSNRPATPIPYVQNVVYENHNGLYNTIPKQPNVPGNGTSHTNATADVRKNSLFGWGGLRKLFDKKLFGRESLERQTLTEEPDVKSNLISRDGLQSNKTGSVIMETQVNLVSGKLVNGYAKQNGVVTSVLNGECIRLERSDSGKGKRPSTLPLIAVKPSKNEESSDDKNASVNDKSSYKTTICPESNPIQNQKFTVVPINQTVDECNNEREDSSKTNHVRNKSASGISQVVKKRKSIGREDSIEQFNEVFSSTSDLSRLKDPNQRIKTPGDVPPSVRRVRGRANSSNSARFSLYDDRMMSTNDDEDMTWSSSVPDGMDRHLKPKKVENLVISNRDSVSSF